MNIPARYCTGYLGDIGVPPDPAPMDFSAWFEAFIGGAWYTFDARHNQPRIGRILIARGRDAADVAISTAFGENRLHSFRVWTDAVGGGVGPHRRSAFVLDLAWLQSLGRKDLVRKSRNQRIDESPHLGAEQAARTVQRPDL